MAWGAAKKPGNFLVIVVLVLITVLGITLRNQRIDRLGIAGRTTSDLQDAPAATPSEPAALDSTNGPIATNATRPASSQGSFPADQTLPQSDDLASSLWKAVYYTALLLGIIIGGAMLIKKYGGERFKQTSSPDIEIIGRKYLNPKQSIAIVRVRKKELLLGITDQSIQLLDRLDSDET